MIESYQLSATSTQLIITPILSFQSLLITLSEYGFLLPFLKQLNVKCYDRFLRFVGITLLGREITELWSDYGFKTN